MRAEHLSIQPSSAVDANELLKRLRPALSKLEADLLQRASDPGVAQALAAEHAREKDAKRTADPVEVWTASRVNQIAAAWVLSLLFVRTLEDRGLIPLRLKASKDHREQLRALAPYLGDRDYLLLVFRELTRYRGVRDVFDAEHNPVWTLGPSAEAAAELLEFAGSEQGLGGMDFSGDTRFLGDVYERLDEGVRDRYALLQTPDFVEAFILDRTLTPALDERGVEGLTVLDPTCGSGHFLLGAFERLRAAWEKVRPDAGPEGWAFAAIEQVYGADINPYAVAIARFRLVLAYLEAAGIRELDAARDLRLKVAVADSLLPPEGAEQLELASVESRPDKRALWQANPFAFAQSKEAQEVLGGRKFEVVVGNPPYITPKDAALREEYRKYCKTAYREYQLVVPFVERFFGFAKPAGRVGAIVGNGFMKRLFGQKLIEEFLPTVDLTQVVDTSGAYIPGHGTPTVILFGRHQAPTPGSTLVAVMGKRGEPKTPDNPADGLVWSSIREHHEEVGYEDDYLSVSLVERARLSTHPWSLKGGGATTLQALLEERASKTLEKVIDVVGFTAITRADELYFIGRGTGKRLGLTEDEFIPLVEGEVIRDWAVTAPNDAVFPFNSSGIPVDIQNHPALLRLLWPHRAHLWLRREPNGNHLERGATWWEWSRFHPERLEGEFRLAFAFVATHNHFVLDRGGKVFKQSAPIIKLPPDATEDDHLALLGYLNSSTVCFWMKQVSHDKGTGTDKGNWQDDPAKFRYEFAGTTLQQLPLPEPLDALIEPARRMDALAQERATLLSTFFASSDANFDRAGTLRKALERIAAREEELLALQVALQEHIDWYVYGLFGLADEKVVQANALTSEGRVVLGARPFEVRAARGGQTEGTDGQTLHAQLDGVVSPELHALWEARIAALETSKNLRLLEDPRWKRRWLITPKDLAGRTLTFQDRLEPQLRNWLLDRIESTLSATKETQTVRQLARALHRDPKVQAVAEVYTNHPDPDLETLFTDLVQSDAVPYLAQYRYKPSGMVKFRAWETTWQAQRDEDAGKDVKVPLPPKYDSGDFARPEYWSLRGKLDVPKERFILYPEAGEEDDPTPLLGWAGWDHADRMAALAALVERQADPERRKPLLAGMAELLPWVVQWHGDDDRYGTPLGELWTGHLQGLLTSEGLTLEALKAWYPEKQKASRKAPKASAPRKARAELGREQLLQAFEALATDGAGVERSALAERLGVSVAAVTQMAQPLLDEGVWVLLKKRPVVYGHKVDHLT